MLRSERETSYGVGMCLEIGWTNISADVIFWVWGGLELMFTLSASMDIHGQIQRGDRGSGPPSPWKITRNICFFSNMGQSYQASFQCRVIIGTLANRHLNGVSLVGRWWPADIVVFGSSHQKKPVAKLDPLWRHFLDPHKGYIKCASHL